MFQIVQTPCFLDDTSLNIFPNLDAETQTGLLYTIYQEMLVKAAWTRMVLCASAGRHFMPFWMASTFVKDLANSWSYDKWSVAKVYTHGWQAREHFTSALLLTKYPHTSQVIIDQICTSSSSGLWASLPEKNSQVSESWMILGNVIPGMMHYLWHWPLKNHCVGLLPSLMGKEGDRGTSTWWFLSTSVDV